MYKNLLMFSTKLIIGKIYDIGYYDIAILA